MDDNQFWLSVWSVVAAAIVTIVVAVCVHEYAIQRYALGQGYVQEQRIGESGLIWRKP